MEEVNRGAKDKQIYSQRLDIYGQALAIYVFIAALFMAFYGSLESGQYQIRLLSPLVILVLSIVVVSSLILLIVAIKRKQLIIDGDTIEIKNRFHSRQFSLSAIQRISVNNSPTKLIKGEAGFVRIKLKGKKKIIFIRTAAYNNDKELLAFFIELKKNLR